MKKKGGTLDRCIVILFVLSGAFLALLLGCLHFASWTALNTVQPVRSSGQTTVLLLNSNSAFMKESALMLASSGYYVLIGVSDDEDALFFKANGHKNIEPVVLDLAKGETVLNVIYRVRELSSFGNRKLGGLVVNFSGELCSHCFHLLVIGIRLQRITRS